MGEKRRETAETGEIVGGELQQWSQLPNESAAAYAGFTAYADLPPGQRTITAAYRALKGYSGGCRRKASRLLRRVGLKIPLAATGGGA